MLTSYPTETDGDDNGFALLKTLFAMVILLVSIAVVSQSIALISGRIAKTHTNVTEEIIKRNSYVEGSMHGI